jgi:hypothetical protein
MIDAKQLGTVATARIPLPTHAHGRMCRLDNAVSMLLYGPHGLEIHRTSKGRKDEDRGTVADTQ